MEKKGERESFAGRKRSRKSPPVGANCSFWLHGYGVIQYASRHQRNDIKMEKSTRHASNERAGDRLDIVFPLLKFATTTYGGRSKSCGALCTMMDTQTFRSTTTHGLLFFFEYRFSHLYSSQTDRNFLSSISHLPDYYSTIFTNETPILAIT